MYAVWAERCGSKRGHGPDKGWNCHLCSKMVRALHSCANLASVPAIFMCERIIGCSLRSRCLAGSNMMWPDDATEVERMGFELRKEADAWRLRVRNKRLSCGTWIRGWHQAFGTNLAAAHGAPVGVGSSILWSGAKPIRPNVITITNTYVLW